MGGRTGNAHQDMQEEVQTQHTNDTSAVIDRVGEGHGALLPPGNYTQTRNSRLGRLDQEAEVDVGRFRTLMPSLLYPEIRKAPPKACVVTHSESHREVSCILYYALRTNSQGTIYTSDTPKPLRRYTNLEP